LREKGAQQPADVDQQRRFFRFRERRPVAAIRVKSREERRVMLFDRLQKRAVEVAQA
jgi:hypothetical protein